MNKTTKPSNRRRFRKQHRPQLLDRMTSPQPDSSTPISPLASRWGTHPAPPVQASSGNQNSPGRPSSPPGVFGTKTTVTPPHSQPKPKPGGGPAAAGGPNSKPVAGAGDAAVDPAKQLLQQSVIACAAAIHGYRIGTWSKGDAVARVVLALHKVNRDSAKNVDAYVKQLDDHDTARTNAATVGQGLAAPAGGASGSGDQLAQAGTPVRKHARIDEPDELAADDDDAPDTKRRAYSFENAAFRDAPAYRAPVSPHVQKTLTARDNYTENLKQAKRDLVRGGRAPSLPAELWDAVLSDQPVDFNKILSARFSSVVEDGFEHSLGDGLVFHVPSQRPRRVVADQSDWQLSFNTWSAALCFAFPHRQDELAEYGESVNELFAAFHKSVHAKVISADIAVRNAIQNDSRASFFDRERIQAIAQRHTSPWGAENAADFSQRQQVSRTSRPLGGARSGTSGELCRNFNRGACTYRNCRHAHSCSRPGCTSPHAEFEHDQAQGGGRGGGRR